MVLATVLAPISPSHSDDAPMRRNLFANDYAQVARVTLPPGAAMPRHDGPARTIYSLSDYTLRWTEGETTTRVDWREGQVHSHEAIEHALENIGNTIADFLVVSRTSTPLSGGFERDDAAAVAGGYAALVAELDGVRVLRVALPPGARQPMHGGAPRLVYALNDLDLKFVGADGTVETKAHASGSVHWHEAGEHAAENVGRETARFVIFAFRE
jgi:quercetin dioxygenase-like cupin family protein